MWAPHRLSIWPVGGGRYGIDAHHHIPTGVEPTTLKQERLKKVAIVKRDTQSALIRIGPVAHAAAWLALEAFLGRPL